MALSLAVTVAVVVFTAVAQGANLVVNAQLLRSGYSFPFALLWFTATSKCLLALPKVLHVYASLRGQGQEGHIGAVDSLLLVLLPAAPPLKEASGGGSVLVTGMNKRDMVGPMLRRVAVLTTLYLVANASALIAIRSLNTGVFSAVSSTVSAFVSLFSRLALRRPFTVPETAAVLLSISGMILTSAPWTATAGSFGAIVAAICSPVAAAAYQVCFAKWFTGASWRDVGLILAEASFGVFLVGSFALPLLTLYGVEDSGWYSMHFNGTQVALLCGCIVAGLLFNAFVNYAVTVTYPLFVATGGVLATPLVVLASGFLDGDWPAQLAWAGMALIALGFALLVGNDLVERRRRSRQAEADALLDPSPADDVAPFSTPVPSHGIDVPDSLPAPSTA